MRRLAMDYLVSWKNNPRRKPLVFRGARQVGKSYLARKFAELHMGGIAEINLEKTPEAGDLFADKSPMKILPRLEMLTGTKIIPGKTLLFLDEIQATPDVFASLRYFHEVIPSLHIIAAGSLLEFVLCEHDFSMPVGRIEYLHLGPVTYEEFLAGSGRVHLAEFLGQHEVVNELPLPVHEQFMGAFREYLAIGGMPEAIQAFVDSSSFLETDKVKQSILSTYQDDFSKYGKRVNVQRLRHVFQKLPMLVGGKFMHSRVDNDAQARDIGEALRMLCLAKVACKVHHSSCNGVPLSAEADEKKFKVLFLDVGLLSRACGLSLLEFEKAQDIMLVNSGAVCEQFIGQHLLYSKQFFDDPELHYWSREKRQSSAEVDYVLSQGNQIIPVEVKAGKTGRLKSLHAFLKEKKRKFGIRFNSDLPSLLDTAAVLPTEESIDYRLLSLPLYMVGQLRRLIRSSI
ncbi:MAG: hypothetical protein A2X45_02695 [Lentisphaerae bacterium GWF2_50_93]|nr:MAG: hypothetical protein A2X45_02695 [Lentisphaerae bacterium GWF2_50_93]